MPKNTTEAQLSPTRHDYKLGNDIPQQMPLIPGEYERLLKFGWDKKTGHPPDRLIANSPIG